MHSELYKRGELPHQIKDTLLKKFLGEIIIILTVIAIMLNIINQFN